MNMSELVSRGGHELTFCGFIARRVSSESNAKSKSVPADYCNLTEFLKEIFVFLKSISSARIILTKIQVKIGRNGNIKKGLPRLVLTDSDK